MAILTNRVIWNDNGTLKDLSVKLNNPVSGSEVIDFSNTDSDKLYIGSELPFNMRYFRVATANAVASSLTVEYWNGNTWVSVVDLIDETSDGTAALAASGMVSWKTDKDDQGWARKDTDEMTGSGLETLKIYDMYWIRLSWSADLTPTLALGYAGYKFSDDEDLGSLYPQLNTSSVKTQFEAGKTDWETQELEAALSIARDLKQRMEIVSTNQILDHEQLRHASIYRVAQIIFNEFGDDFDDEWERAGALYREALRDIIRADRNKNARLDGAEWMEDISLVRR